MRIFSRLAGDDLEEVDLRWQVALVAQDGLGGYDWSNDFEVEPVNYALMVISSSSSSSSSDSEVQKCSKQCLESFKTLQKNYDTEREKHNKAKLEIRGYEISLESLESRILRQEKNELAWGQTNDENIEKPKSASESVVSNSKIDRDRVIIEDWNSNDEEKVSEVQTVRPETQTVKTRDDKSGQNSKKQGMGFRKVKDCFVCKSTYHLIKDCNFHDKKSQEPKLKNVVNIGKREGKPVLDNTKRINHQNFSKYPHLSKTFVPSGVLTRTGLNRPSVSTARPVYATRPIYPRMDNVRPRGSCSPIKRSYYTKPAFRPKDLKQDVKTFGVQNMTTVGIRAVVNTRKGKLDTNLKKSRWVWRPKGNYLDHVSKNRQSKDLVAGSCSG
ncbi:hypothetical protein Tco_0462455, partial [Tanacetum coccineum]